MQVQPLQRHTHVRPSEWICQAHDQRPPARTTPWTWTLWPEKAVAFRWQRRYAAILPDARKGSHSIFMGRRNTHQPDTLAKSVYQEPLLSVDLKKEKYFAKQRDGSFRGKERLYNISGERQKRYIAIGIYKTGHIDQFYKHHSSSCTNDRKQDALRKPATTFKRHSRLWKNCFNPKNLDGVKCP